MGLVCQLRCDIVLSVCQTKRHGDGMNKHAMDAQCNT